MVSVQRTQSSYEVRSLTLLSFLTLLYLLDADLQKLLQLLQIILRTTVLTFELLHSFALVLVFVYDWVLDFWMFIQYQFCSFDQLGYIRIVHALSDFSGVSAKFNIAQKSLMLCSVEAGSKQCRSRTRPLLHPSRTIAFNPQRFRLDPLSLDADANVFVLLVAILICAVSALQQLFWCLMLHEHKHLLKLCAI